MVARADPSRPSGPCRGTSSSPHASSQIGEVPIVEAERIVGIVYNAEGQVGRIGLPKLYDLIFTDRRLVGVVTVKTGGARIAGQMLGGKIGQAVAASVARAVRTRSGRPMPECHSTKLPR